MPEPEAPAARSGATQGAAYSESASNGASMPAPACSLFPKLAFFISLLGPTYRLGQPADNNWLAISQATVTEDRNTRWPDVVLFVNGSLGA